MSGLEIFIIAECVIVIVLIMVIIAMAASAGRRNGKKEAEEAKAMLYDPYGLYAPVSYEELAEIDRHAAASAGRDADKPRRQ